MKIIELDYKDFFNKELDSPLRKVSVPVADFTNESKDIVKELEEQFDTYKITVGLSAPQVGINKRVIIINLNREKEENLVIINPVVISNTGKTKKSFESCLSVPKYRGQVKRKEKLHLEYQDINGEKQTLETKGFLARVILHEIDHLDGVLYVDRMESGDKLEKVKFDWE